MENKLDDIERKKVSVIVKYCVANFNEADWYDLGILTGYLEVINSHDRLLRSYNFGDDDYSYSVAEVINNICNMKPLLSDKIIDHYDIDLWYESAEPKKFERIFGNQENIDAKFWKKEGLRVFFSHVSNSRGKVGSLADHLKRWGIETFVAHNDIKPSLEWQSEIEKALLTMDVLVAIIEEGFKESCWCDQEVGFAFGRKLLVIPLRRGMVPYGFLGKIQGLNIKGKNPLIVSNELIQIFLSKQQARSKVISQLPKALNKEDSTQRIEKIKLLDEWKILSDDDLKTILESMNLTDKEKILLKDVIQQVKAFKDYPLKAIEDDFPF